MPAVSEAVHRPADCQVDAMLPIGEVVAAADTGLMGFGVAEGAEAPADDDDLVNALLADDAADPGMVDSASPILAWATLARIMVVPVLANPALKGWISARSILPSRSKQPPTRRRMQMMPELMVTVRTIRSCLAPSARPIRRVMRTDGASNEHITLINGLMQRFATAAMLLTVAVGLAACSGYGACRGRVAFLHRPGEATLECVVCAGPVDVTGLKVPQKAGLVGRAFSEGVSELVADAAGDGHISGQRTASPVFRHCLQPRRWLRWVSVLSAPFRRSTGASMAKQVISGRKICRFLKRWHGHWRLPCQMLN